MKNKGITILFWAITLLPLIISVSIFNDLPDKIPAHYNINGEVDRWGSKWEIFILPILSIVVCGILYPIMMLQKKDQQNHALAANIVLLSLPAVFFILFLFFTMTAMQRVENIAGVPIMNVLPSVLGLLFAVLGYAMPKTKRNRLFGIRTPWTLENEEVWEKTHQFAGKLWGFGGLGIALVCLFVRNDVSFLVLLASILLLAIVSIIYSYMVYKEIVRK